MAKFPDYRLIDYYKSRYLNKTFFETLLYCVSCDLHFSVNILDVNGHGVKCARCQSDDLIEVGTAEVKLVEIWHEGSVGASWNDPEVIRMDEDEEIEPTWAYYGARPQSEYDK